MIESAPLPGSRLSIPDREKRITRLISLWFLIQVVLNVAVSLYLTLHPPDEPGSWFDRADLAVNTGINAALAAGFWKRTDWVWGSAVFLVPVYWALHAWHMLVPVEGSILWPFLMVDALVLGWLLGPGGRRAMGIPSARWRGMALIPAPMFGLGLYAVLAPVTGLGPAAVAGAAVAAVGWKREISNLRSQI